jgi:hypothetical protein
MTSTLPCARRFSIGTIALVLALPAIAGKAVMAQDVGVSPGYFQQHHVMTDGTLSYGGDEIYPGYPGFGLRFHPGYGYGGKALGTGALGGYPFYGGPGYPHPAPELRRCGGITPFLFYGGPDYPRYGYSNYFSEVGPLVVTQPVALQTTGHDQAHAAGSAVYPYNVGYGPYTGVLPYPEGFFARFTAAAATSGSSAAIPGRTPTVTNNADPVRNLGIDEESVVDADGVRAIKVARVYSGTAAETAGLKPGDVIRSINGYRTEEPGNLAWIVINKAPDKVLAINVRTVSDGLEHTVTAKLP